MPVRVAVPREQTTDERRVALVPDVAKRLSKAGMVVLIEKGMGESAFFSDDDYGENVKVYDDVSAMYADTQVILCVQPPPEDHISRMKEGTVLIGLLAPHKFPERAAKMAEMKITAFSMELVPRISRAQAIDALSSQAAVAGYKAVLSGADLAGIFFPMLTTAAGTMRPAKVLVIGAGVAGLQAIATARRLGAMVEAYDVRPATREQCESLGAKFVDTGIKAEGKGGYARELTEEEKQQQRDILARHIAAANVVITTAALPGRTSPKIIFKDMVEAMHAGSVIVDLAAEGGGNCEMTQPGETIHYNDIIIHAPLNLPARMPVHASEMYAKNLFNLLTLMIKDGELTLNWEDEVIAGSVLTHAGEIKHEPTRTLVEQQRL
jgi:NAD(P) transhydrogenase subunit alpha